jgi:hypothetical protein
MRRAEDGLRAGEPRPDGPRIRRVTAHAASEIAARERVDSRCCRLRSGVIEIDEQNAGGIPAKSEIIGGSHTLAARSDNGIRE